MIRRMGQHVAHRVAHRIEQLGSAEGAAAMKQPSQQEQEARKVECPYCGAKPVVRCFRIKDGWGHWERAYQSKSHAARYQIAEMAADLEKEFAAMRPAENLDLASDSYRGQP